jgi:hypothetical protein
MISCRLRHLVQEELVLVRFWAVLLGPLAELLLLREDKVVVLVPF